VKEPEITTFWFSVFTKDAVEAKEAELTVPTKEDAVKAFTAQEEVPNNDPVNPRSVVTDPLTLIDPVIANTPADSLFSTIS
jgi:hypothetical protein